MIALDTNILVHAHRGDSPFHEVAFNTIRELAEGADAWAIPWPCLHEFLAVTTHPRIFQPPTELGQAIDQIEAWMESPKLCLLAENDGYFSRLKSSAIRGKVVGPRIHDARIATLCLHFRVSMLLTADRDFSRFPELKTRNPLVT